MKLTSRTRWLLASPLLLLLLAVLGYVAAGHFHLPSTASAIW